METSKLSPIRKHDAFGHRHTGRKKITIMPNLSKNIFNANFPKLLLMGGGGGGGDAVDEIFDYYMRHTVFPNIEGISPIYFHNKPILPDCEANIAQLA